ncbi:uncharacterized protein LOC123203282 [Mangifera indica]|uniref:uncharacterized protein LOC123203282 n=1 Tax=Mangifera indica TaxID=29780 RepID=UPI001CFA3712|nr:uncharacterized protein LOC123203282 [Mangifera indica]XP_044475532.1 uncharacterized protein LOC123203282 [Mangifera indica]
MTLEDFFSKIEMKDGLKAPSRVEELINVMQKEKDSVVKNIGDATRQWAAIANAITATENRDCLDLFIKLDGLQFIGCWLKDAQKFGHETNESSVEESITAMLQALGKLHINNECSVSSGIWLSVKRLLDHSSSQVQNRARALFDSWKQGRVSDAVDHNVGHVGPCQTEGVPVSSMDVEEGSQSKCSSPDAPPEASLKEENSGAEISPSNSESLRQEKAEELQTQTHNNKQHSLITLDQTNMEDKPPDHLTSSILSKNLVLESTLIKDKSPISTEGISSIEICKLPVPKQSHDEGQSDALKMNELSDDEKNVQKVGSFSDKLCLTVAASTSNILDSRTVSSGVNVADAHEIVTESALENNFDNKEDDLLIKVNVADDMAVTDSYSTQLLKTTGEDDECHSDAMQDSSGNDCIYRKHKDLEISFSRVKEICAIDDDKEEHTSDGGSNSRNDCDFSKPAMGNRSPEVNNQRKSDIELEYGIVDALEVARKVAQEVEREVEDYGERSCSSSEKFSDGGFRQPDSSDSINGKQDLINEVPSKEVPTGQHYSAVAYPEGEGHVINSENVGTEPEDGIADMESSQVTEAAQEPKVNPEKALCDFDLNQEVCSDDMERLFNPVSNPVSVVSASRPVAAPGLPAAPLQFEGTLGWKGIAATSAFRPASPRRVSDSDKTALTMGRVSNSSKRRPDCLDIDLNVAECGDDKLADVVAEKKIPVSSGHQSAESSLDVSPRKSERLKLDLNRIGDDSDAPPTVLRMDGRFLYNRNGYRSPSPASSSSSMQPASLRNIDLNDRPYLQNDILDQGIYHGKYPQNVSVFGMSKPDEPVISIMGARVEVNRKNFVPQAASLLNGKALETAMDTNMARTGSVLALGPTVSYAHSPLMGYNGFAAATMLSYSSPMYGPVSSVPYMVDSRGAPVVPQIVGSAAAVPPSYSQPPFIMSLGSGTSGLNGAGPSLANFDLNSGFPVEGENRDSLGLRQLFMPGQGQSMEEHPRVSFQPSSSSGGVGKRKEPDGGWEAYPNPYNYRNQQQQPPWK